MTTVSLVRLGSFPRFCKIYHNLVRDNWGIWRRGAEGKTSTHSCVWEGGQCEYEPTLLPDTLKCGSVYPYPDSYVQVLTTNTSEENALGRHILKAFRLKWDRVMFSYLIWLVSLQGKIWRQKLRREVLWQMAVCSQRESLGPVHPITTF